jgi:2-polyprenyl-3-methyl-5-hydroxy-6-metoxy-1,4-benzoquinol methylase
MKKTLCRICKSENVDNFFDIDLINASFLHQFKNIILSSCSECGFCFSSNIRQEDCNEYYQLSNNYTNTIYFENTLYHDKYQHLEKLLIDLNISKNDDIIDLTGYNGSLLNYLNYLGYTNLTYCDISDLNINLSFDHTEHIEQIEHMQPTFTKHKLNLMNINDFNTIGKKFKLIFLNHTLEHIVDLENVINNIKILMNETSLLYVEVPDINRIKLNDNPFLEITYEHVNFFNSYYLDRLFNSVSLQSVAKGTLDFKYRINLTINALYTVYKFDTISDKSVFINTITNTKYDLIKYILDSKNSIDLIYDQIDKTKEYSIVGIGLYAIFFLSFFKDIKINKYYDETRTGYIDNKPIQHLINCFDSDSVDSINSTNSINNSITDNLLILTPTYFNIIYNKLKNLGIDTNKIIKIIY